MPGALDGIRILDFTRVLAGPYCTMMLADLGAEVIKIERPGLGDDTRHWGPPWVGDTDRLMSAYFVSVNRNKRSLTLDLKHPTSQTIVRDLVRHSQILVENFKVGEMQAFGLSYDDLRPINAALIYCSISGYGQSGPYQQRPGYDAVIQAVSGLMSITGPPNEAPGSKVGVAITDVVTGLTAATSILAALHHSQQTGQGQYIDIALLDSQIAALVNIASSYLVTGATPQRMGNAHPNIVPYQTFAAGDGQHLVVAVGNDAQFAALCAILGLDLHMQLQFQTNASRVAHRAELIPILEHAFRSDSAAHWEAKLLQAGIPAGIVQDLATVLDSDQIQARGLVHKLRLPDETPLRLVGPPAQLSATPASIRRPPPALGEHNAEILGEVLQLDEAQIQRLRESKALG